MNLNLKSCDRCGKEYRCERNGKRQFITLCENSCFGHYLPIDLCPECHKLIMAVLSSHDNYRYAEKPEEPGLVSVPVEPDKKSKKERKK